MYERDWKKNLREVYAFEDGSIENVTEMYKMPKAKAYAKHGSQCET